MSNRLGAFDSDLRQRHAVGKFDEELFRYGRFDKEMIEGAIWTVALVGFFDADFFGVEKISDVLHATGVVDGDAFGAETSRVRTAQSGFLDPDAFGAETVKVIIHESGLLDPDLFGVGKITDRIAETGFVDADAFGALAGKVNLPIIGFLDADLFGAGLIRLTVHETGFLDADAFGTLHVVPALRITGAASTDAFGALRLLRLVVHETGFLDIDHFGVLISPQHSPRRNSRRRPHLGNIARPRQIRQDGQVQEYFDVLIFNEPADIQERAGSFFQQESGLVTTRIVIIFLDIESGLTVGDHFVTSDATFLVTNIATKEKQLRADVERIVTP